MTKTRSSRGCTAPPTSAATTAAGVVRAVVGVSSASPCCWPESSSPLIPLGVAGFVVMLASASYGIASWQRMTGHRVVAPSDRPKLRGRGVAGDHAPSERRSVVQRLEDRWQRRQDERGQ